MEDINANVIAFQCPQCGFALEQTVGQIKSPESMRCAGCGVGIVTDAEESRDAAADIRDAAERFPEEITIKFIDRAKKAADGA
ncbi:peptide subunit release factor 1 (eRF1) [Rhodoblastus sphagnicola]|uniref:hypothetical protein n=1 Tax=Rhodoblastus sphagnicola TaxID=333368 RepID=UPI0011B0ABCD|nr:hypothetical protein [Rhodoblastus sphagnicola]MBB4200323.1 peptide subunit release factor 1 (eRF1) [Rhodoblastus sphagnicola]